MTIGIRFFDFDENSLEAFNTIERPSSHFDQFFHSCIRVLTGVFGQENMAKLLDGLSSVGLCNVGCS